MTNPRTDPERLVVFLARRSYQIGRDFLALFGLVTLAYSRWTGYYGDPIIEPVVVTYLIWWGLCIVAFVWTLARVIYNASHNAGHKSA